MATKTHLISLTPAEKVLLRRMPAPTPDYGAGGMTVDTEDAPGLVRALFCMGAMGCDPHVVNSLLTKVLKKFTLIEGDF